MAVSVVVGGQFGSEGKGKVAQYWATQRDVAAVVRVGGSNSGHTGYASGGRRFVLRHLPTASLLPRVQCVLGPGTYLDLNVLLREIEITGLAADRLWIDERAVIVSESDQREERDTGLPERIGSTGTGTGAAVVRRIRRGDDVVLARDVDKLRPYVADTSALLRELLDRGDRVIVEGTQGFGLSVLHSPYYPFATSRDTTAAGALAEAGLSPLDVDEVVLVIRAFPIRVGGHSGPLPRELDWAAVTAASHAQTALEEFTSVTGRLRRVAEFDADIVRRAILVNRPTSIVMNHVDYVDAHSVAAESLTEPVRSFLANVERQLDASVDVVGLGPTSMVVMGAPRVRLAHA
jgi:adenylosuccinate synthase